MPGCCELLGLCPEPRDGFAGPGEKSWGSVTADSQPGWLQQMGMGRIRGAHRGRCWQRYRLWFCPCGNQSWLSWLQVPLPKQACLGSGRDQGCAYMEEPRGRPCHAHPARESKLQPPRVSPAQPLAGGVALHVHTHASSSFKRVSDPSLGQQPPEDSRRAKDGIGPSFPLPW